MSFDPDSITTRGIELKRGATWWRQSIELLSSMRFAISVLVVIAIASVIGTVVQQNQPMINYVNQFGPFWFELFKKLGLYSVYSATWFFVLLTFLVVSTSLCIIRNAPKFLREVRDMRDNVREASLRAFGHKYEADTAMSRADSVRQLEKILRERGFQVKQKAHEGATLLAAKAGSSNRLGYIAAHASIVIMAAGYLLDTDLPMRVQMWWQDKHPVVTGSALITEVPPASRFGPNNLSFRANALIPEGQETDVAIINYRDGAFIQDLPFTLKLEKFHVEYYPTGMPRSFVSDVILTDKISGEVITRSIEVNKPLIHRGIAIYQSSFDDGGSALKLVGHPMRGASFYEFPFIGNVGQNANLTRDGDKNQYMVEFTALRVINVENLPGQDNQTRATEKRLQDHVANVVASTTKPTRTAHLRNVGPSVQYKIRDAAGQAREYHNYMLPFELDGRMVFLSGMRDNPNDDFKYLRIPADQDSSLKEFMRLRAALQNPALRQAAASRFAKKSIAAGQSSAMEQPLRDSADRSLEIFAQGGFQAVAQFVERSVPQQEQQKAAEVLIRILQGSMWELWQTAREQDKLPVMQGNDDNGAWLQASLNALSDSFLYGAPVMLTLKEFEHVQASVFQMTRAPGTSTVYLGCLLLVIGIFAMFYVRERRIWIWVKDQPPGTRWLMAMSSTRRTLDFEKEFTQLREALQQATQPVAANIDPTKGTAS
jgi:cytochrome c biogenesis protein